MNEVFKNCILVLVFLFLIIFFRRKFEIKSVKMKQIKFILFTLLFCNNYIRESLSTRLPLEVYEISSRSVHQDYDSEATETAAVVHSNSKSNNNNNNNNTQNKSTGPPSDVNTYYVIKSIYNHNSERKRSRHIVEQQNRQQHKQKIEIHQEIPKTRILYQTGNSEDDLPVCAANAVCSKIDVYDVPWIERQCRCPDTPTKNPLTILHRKDYQHQHQHHHHHHHQYQYQQNHDGNSRNGLSKGGDHKRRSLEQENSKQFDDQGAHLRKLMQKLGAVYQEDIVLDENDLTSSQTGHKQNTKNDLSSNGLKDAHLKYNQRNRSELNVGNHHRNRRNHHRGEQKGRLRYLHRKDIPHIGGCPSSLEIDDGHTIIDKTRHYKLCNPVHKLPVCKYFRDYTWTLTTSSFMNVTEQIVHCRCPKDSVTYLTKRESTANGSGYTYLFACSPQTRLRCQRKEPCKLFTVRKRQELLDEVNTNPLCQCPRGHRCPRHHTDPEVIAGKSFIEDNIQTYSGYCMAND